MRRYRTLRDLLFGEHPLRAIAEHRKLLSLFRSRQIRPLLRIFPGLTQKYFGGYLARSFDKTARRDSLLHHYRFFQRCAPAEFYTGILQGQAVLWRRDILDNHFDICLSFNRRFHYEGDLSLVFRNEGASAFEISFTVVPGHLVGVAVPDVLLVSRVQGTARLPQIRNAAKMCHEVAPPYLLMTALEAIATALAIPVIMGVSVANQIAKEGGGAEHLFDYDAFWRVLLAEDMGNGFFRLPVPLPHKPLEQVSATHRRRARAKRAFKAEVRAAVETAFRDSVLARFRCQ